MYVYLSSYGLQFVILQGLRPGCLEGPTSMGWRRCVVWGGNTKRVALFMCRARESCDLCPSKKRTTGPVLAM